MAPRVKARAAAGAPDDSEEDDLNNASTGPENKRTMPASTRAKTTRRASAGKPAPKRKAAPKTQARPALKDRTNEQHASDTEELDEFDHETMEASKPKAKRAKTAAVSKTSKKPAAPKAASAKKGKIAKRAPSPGPLAVIPETQQDPEQMEDVEQSIEVSLDPSNMDIAQEPTPKPIQKFYQRAPSVPVQPLHPRPSARPVSAQSTYAPVRERSGSAGGGERFLGDPELRRALNEMTKKYENLQLKYESLEDVGKTDAETNFEKLKRASDQKTKDANELISSLKKELAELRKTSAAVTSETSGLHKQVTSLTTTNEKIVAERDELKDKLKLSQNEVKSMEAKLIAARQQLSSSALEAKAQASAATKPNSNSGLGDAQKEAKMKENLYADLTGLIVCGVKRMDGEDVYDCIQTGRNGTLHFHLSIANDTTTPHPKTPSGVDYAEAEFAYEPLLDESRDKELLDLLPDYLTEEICFPRNHAQRFYSKVVDSMTKKIVIEDD
ncbi:uncharacterized protein RCC_05361 [Ramularia collo-cygni]|uniref:Monopolin complex subunit Csm1/Pcs1 C-terminal domain-containing protein n=1 Tax=Ramularia collo-cygni TaxID=112498 RepID=A0A2D3V217_9PEZI|nr:uncharacterized protein RCC_05361 [Ramularia collo-cygni]CZT19510.1 uncharacterized protein RCC_05361 [Ramularia collo-cygni]